MTEVAWGIVGTLAGTIVGFGLLWLKELLHERRGFNLDVLEAEISFLKKEGSHCSTTFKIKLVLRNKSTIAQPIWELFLDGPLLKHPFPQTGGTPHNQVKDGKPIKNFGSLLVEPKRVYHLDFYWENVFLTRWTENIDGKPWFIRYRTFQGTRKLRIYPVIYSD